MSLLLLFNQQTGAPVTYGYWGISMNIDPYNEKFLFSSSMTPNYKLKTKMDSVVYNSFISPSYM